MNGSTVVKEYHFNESDIQEIGYLHDDAIKDCRNKFFHTFGYRLVYDNKYTNISNIEEVNFTVTP